MTNDDKQYLRELEDHVVELWATARKAQKRILNDAPSQDRPHVSDIVTHLIMLEQRDVSGEMVSAQRAAVAAAAKSMSLDAEELYDDEDEDDDDFGGEDEDDTPPEDPAPKKPALVLTKTKIPDDLSGLEIGD